jgi:hypothetical protein
MVVSCRPYYYFHGSHSLAFLKKRHDIVRYTARSVSGLGLYLYLSLANQIECMFSLRPDIKTSSRNS